jgi:mRNA interferase YafQ
MILKSTYTNQFEKDLKLCKKRNKDLQKLKNVMGLLIEGNPLSAKQKDHKLIGNFKARRECHIEPDWLLIYKIEGDTIIFERTGSHSDLFS